MNINLLIVDISLSKSLIVFNDEQLVKTDNNSELGFIFQPLKSNSAKDVHP